MAPSFMSSLAVLPIIYLARQIDLTNEDNLFYAKTGYALAVITVALIYGVVYTRIVGTKEAREVTVPPAPGSGPDAVPEKLPVWQYDLQELRKAATQLLIGIGFTTLLVYKFEIRQVLILQAIFALRGLYSNQLVQIHLLGRPATGDLKRPFKAPNPLAAMLENMTQDDSASGASGKKSKESKKSK